MNVFVTGASGWIGSAVIPELLTAGHQVVGLARSDSAADTVAGLGADVLRGSLDDLDVLRAGAAASDGVVHLGYVHDFSHMVDAARTDRAALDAIGEALAGSGRPLVMASGTLGLAPGAVGTELDWPAVDLHPRIANARAAVALAERDVRTVIVRFAPTVHGAGDHGFVARLVEIAREKGVSGYVGDGTNRWPAVHRFDAAELVRLAFTSAPAGSVVHAVAEEGVPASAIATAIGHGLDLPVVSVPAEEAEAHFGWLGAFFAADAPASNELTRKLLGWTPTHPTLIEDLDAGHYYG